MSNEKRKRIKKKSPHLASIRGKPLKVKVAVRAIRYDTIPTSSIKAEATISKNFFGFALPS